MSRKGCGSSKTGKSAVGKKTGSKRGMSYSDLSEDEIDKHYASREKIMLAESEEDMGSEDGFGEDALMDLPSDQEAEYSEEDVLYDGSESEEQEEKWGKSKGAFYSADRDAGEEEASEARKLQKKRLAGMKAEDFTGGKKSVSSRKTGPVELDFGDSASEIEGSEEEDVDGEEDVNNSQEEDSASAEDEFELSGEQVAQLTEEEKIELISKHSEEFAALMKDFKTRLAYLDGALKPLMASLKDLPTSEGLSFLKVKYQLLTAYCTNVAFYMKLKLMGKPIQGHPVLGKLIKYRLLLEKIKPMEAKLRSQIDRLLRVANGQTDAEEQEAGKYRPNLDMFAAVGSDEDDGSEDDETAGKYRAPKLVPMHFPEDESATAKQKKHEEKERRLALNSRLVKDIRAEFDDAPEEEAIDAVYGKADRRREQTERDAYEEENYVRFTLDKKTKRRLEAKNKAVDELEDLNDFLDEIGGGRKTGKKAVDISTGSIAMAPAPKKKSKEQVHSDESDIEDDYYEKVKAAKKAKASGAHQKPKAPVHFLPQRDMKDASSSRPANWKMMKNKGIVSNGKAPNNPRLRQRQRFEKAQKRLGSFKPLHKGHGGKYGGEDSGIRTNLVKSTKF